MTMGLPPFRLDRPSHSAPPPLSPLPPRRGACLMPALACRLCRGGPPSGPSRARRGRRRRGRRARALGPMETGRGNEEQQQCDSSSIRQAEAGCAARHSHAWLSPLALFRPRPARRSPCGLQPRRHGTWGGAACGLFAPPSSCWVGGPVHQTAAERWRSARAAQQSRPGQGARWRTEGRPSPALSCPRRPALRDGACGGEAHAHERAWLAACCGVEGGGRDLAR